MANKPSNHDVGITRARSFGLADCHFRPNLVLNLHGEGQGLCGIVGPQARSFGLMSCLVEWHVARALLVTPRETSVFTAHV